MRASQQLLPIHRCVPISNHGPLRSASFCCCLFLIIAVDDSCIELSLIISIPIKERSLYPELILSAEKYVVAASHCGLGHPSLELLALSVCHVKCLAHMPPLIIDITPSTHLHTQWMYCPARVSGLDGHWIVPIVLVKVPFPHILLPGGCELNPHYCLQSV